MPVSYTHLDVYKRQVLGEGTVRSLADLGITTDPQTRQLKLDQTKLDKALTANPADVTKLLTGDNGLAKSFDLSLIHI